MKFFVEPEVIVEKFELEDVIATSGVTGEDELPMG